MRGDESVTGKWLKVYLSVNVMVDAEECEHRCDPEMTRPFIPYSDHSYMASR